MSNVYPPGPSAVPENLTKPSGTYRRNAWIAVAGLVAFIAVYLALAAWFSVTAYRLISSAFAPGGDWFWGLGTGLPAALLAAFMLKALFFVKRAEESRDIEVSPEKEPRLFAFLHQLADEAGAPRPHRVFLSPRVNAAVFYDLTLFNLFFPSRKNLEIGLGLINTLNLSEFKAVLAHEFGHFAQKSMAVGSWVYIAQQIAAHLIHQRDMIDSFLHGLSRFDLRIAWIGWLLRLVIWSIRSLLDTVFILVVAAQRALSREMELQADLVAVSLTGSDSLIHALHKLHAADEAWDRSIGFAQGQAQNGHGVADLFAVQSHIIERLGVVLDDPTYGKIPPLPESGLADHRVFTQSIASPPKMWSTHPENAVREENAKRHYIESAIDERSAWVVFEDASVVRAKMSEHLFQGVEVTVQPIEQSLESLDQQFNKAYLRPSFRGAYLGRSIVRNAQTPQELYDANVADADLVATLNALYPTTLGDDLETLRHLYEELANLEGIHNKTLTINGGIIRHRGKQLERADLPQAIESLKAEIEQAESQVRQHDFQCRSAHLCAARQLGGGWEATLKGTIALLHYVDHSEAELHDAHGYLGNAVAVVTADGHVSGSEFNRLMRVSNEVYDSLASVYSQASEVDLGPELANELGIANWSEALGELKLPAPTRDNLNEWIQAIDGWIGSTINILSSVKMATLEHLLGLEARVSQNFQNGAQPDGAPSMPKVPTEFRTRVIGTERKLQTKLDFWDRFQTADGFVPAALRFSAAAMIVGSVIVAGQFAGGAMINIYNGLAHPVRVEISGSSAVLPPFSADTIYLSSRSEIEVAAFTPGDRQIEAFTAETGQMHSTFVYNVASASPLVKWHQSYGSARDLPHTEIGAPRWTSVDADVFFAPPPESISSSGNGGVRSVLSGMGDENPYRLLQLVGNEKEVEAMIRSHVVWDKADSAYIAFWLQLALEHMEEDLPALLAARLANYPNDVFGMRMQQDSVEGTPAHKTVCADHNALADAQQENVNLQYLSVRCLTDDTAQNQRFLAGLERWPEHPWFNFAGGAIYAEQGDWDRAAEAWLTTLNHSRAFNEWITVDLARILRLMPDSGDEIQSLASHSDQLGFLLSVEQESALEGALSAYAKLSRGELEQAQQLASSLGEDAHRLTRLLAASDGADTQMVQSALALPPTQGLDDSTVWLSWSLAVKAGQDPAPFEQWADTQIEDNDQAVAFLRLLQSGQDLSGADQTLNGLPPRVRGQLLAAGLVLLGNEAPDDWRRQAQALLFATEKPFFL